MRRSGIDAVDRRLGGLLEGRAYVLTGAAGAGKTIACLAFLREGAARGERGTLLTAADPDDVLATAAYAGVDLAAALRERRVEVIRLARAAPPDDARARRDDAAPPRPAELALRTLEQAIDRSAPARIAVDSVFAVLGAEADDADVARLAELLERSGATAVVTHRADLSGPHDARLDALTERAAAVVHLAHAAGSGARRLELRRARCQVVSAAPVEVELRAGAGLVARGERRSAYAGEGAEETRRKALVLTVEEEFPDDYLATLCERFDVAVRPASAASLASLAHAKIGAVVIEVRRGMVTQGLALVRELRRIGNRAPIALLTPFALRTQERARALRAGADEFLSTRLGPEEFLERFETLVRRGRAPAGEVELRLAADVDGPTDEARHAASAARRSGTSRARAEGEGPSPP